MQQQQPLQASERIRYLVASLSDPSKNAAAAMELQSMALDSVNQLAIARSGALMGLASMVASSDIVQVPCFATA
jgi:hypothetical protein